MTKEMKNKIKRANYYRQFQARNEQTKQTLFQILLKTGFVFVMVFVFLYSYFVSAATPPKKIKVVITNIARGASLNIGMPALKKDDVKIIELCRGVIKPKCTLLAKNVYGIKKAVKIPIAYPLGDAEIKVSEPANIGNGKPTKIVLSNKKVKIVPEKSSGGSGGGGGGGSSDSGSDVVTTGSVVTTPVPTSSSGGTTGGIIIRATPTPTPPLYNTTHPVLINH